MKSLKLKTKKKIKDTEILKNKENKEVKSLLEEFGLLDKNPKNIKSK